MSDLQFYNLMTNDDDEIYDDHSGGCVCCGGSTEEVSAEMGVDFDVYRCRVCGTRISSEKGLVEVFVEPRRVENVLKDKYSQYDWDAGQV